MPHRPGRAAGTKAIVPQRSGGVEGLHHESTTDGFEVGFCRPAFVKREMEVEVDVVFRSTTMTRSA